MTRKPEHLLRKLEQFCALSEEEKRCCGCDVGERHFAPGEDLIHERKQTEGVFVIVDGLRLPLQDPARWTTPDRGHPAARRHVRPAGVPAAAHGSLHLRAESRPPTTMITAGRRRRPARPASARLTRALWWTTAVEDSITREWVVNVGYRTALERVAHLFCEVFWRLEAVGLTRNNQCQLAADARSNWATRWRCRRCTSIAR